MEENNKPENNEEKKHICFKNHCWKNCIATIIAAFLGGFLAMYFVTDQVMERCHKDHLMLSGLSNIDDFNKNIEFNRKYNEKMMKKQARQMKTHSPFATDTIFIFEPVKITSYFKDDDLNIVISLKEFQGDENKINYNISGNKLTVFGESKIRNGKKEEDIAFSHDHILPDNSDTANIKKVKAGDNLIISIPLRESLKD